MQDLIIEYPLTLSPSHPLTLSPSHPLTLSPSHPLTLSPSHHGKHWSSSWHAVCRKHPGGVGAQNLSLRAGSTEIATSSVDSDPVLHYLSTIIHWRVPHYCIAVDDMDIANGAYQYNINIENMSGQGGTEIIKCIYNNYYNII